MSVESNEKGNWVKVIDNDKDGVADYVLKVVYTTAQVAKVSSVILSLCISRAVSSGSDIDFVADTPVGHPAIALAEVEVTPEKATSLGYDSLKLEEIEGVITANEYADLNEDDTLPDGRTEMLVDGKDYTIDYTTTLDDIGESHIAYSYRLTGSGLAQHSFSHILGDTALIRNGSSADLPVATFQPKGNITRAEVAAIIYRIATGDVTDSQASIYSTYGRPGPAFPQSHSW